MQDRVGVPDVLEIGVEGAETMVRRLALSHEQAHGITLVAEAGLHAYENVAEMAAEDERVRAAAVEMARRRGPAGLDFGPPGPQALVVSHGHPIGHARRHAQLGRVALRNQPAKIL